MEFDRFVKEGKIEYLDANESDNAFIALTVANVKNTMKINLFFR